ncbi:MAG TPA: tetratricopeptide repeat protein [Polyangia bacterium]|nr:tetratricopeptide repeat protein [Polyangia bacterium]
MTGSSPVSVAAAVLLLSLSFLASCATTGQPVTKIVNGRVIITRAVSPEAYEHVTRALVYEEEERWDDAAAELQRALPFDDEAAEVRAHLADLFVRLGRLDDASEQVEHSLRTEPTVDGWLASAHVREARGDPGGQLESLRRAVEIARRDNPAGEDAGALERAFLALSDAQIVSLDIDGAYESCRQLAEASPASIRGRVQLAGLAWTRGALGEAEAAITGALEEEPADIDARLLLAELQVAQGKIAAAKTSFRGAIDRSDAPGEIAEAFAGWLVARGDGAESVDLSERFTAEGSGADMLMIGSRVERAAKRPERARALAEKALKLGAPAGRAAILIGQAMADQGQRSAAVATYLAVAADAPEAVEAHLRAAELLRDDGKPDEAMRALDGAVASRPAPESGAGGNSMGGGKPKPGDAEVLIAIARSGVDEKRGDAAMAARRLDEALAKNPDEPRLLIARAGVEERRGDWRRAITIAERLLAHEPRSVEALNFLGFVESDHGFDAPRALKRLQAAAALNPGSGAIIDSLGWAYFRVGDLARASAFLEQAGRLEPSDPEILGHLGDLYAKRQDRAHALESYRKALKLSPPERLTRELQERVRTLDAKSAAGR